MNSDTSTSIIHTFFIRASRGLRAGTCTTVVGVCSMYNIKDTSMTYMVEVCNLIVIFMKIKYENHYLTVSIDFDTDLLWIRHAPKVMRLGV